MLYNKGTIWFGEVEEKEDDDGLVGPRKSDRWFSEVLPVLGNIG